MLANPYQKYQNNSIMTASPGELTLMLYNGTIKFINQGIEAIEKNEPSKAHNYIMRAQDIVEELHVTLDTKYEIGQQIEPLYVFIKELLVQGNIHKDITKLKEANELIREFRDMWQDLLKVGR